MGIAASQARFLAITSRKASCEFKSMDIAQEKLSITRALTQATQKYQSALNQTKLVWDMNGTTGTTSADGQTYDLTYDVMMTPSALNGYDPYFITSRDGTIVLNSKMATAARNSGITQKGGTTPSLEGYQKFLKELGVQGYIASSQVRTMVSDPVYYDPDAGIGGEPIDKTQANAMTYGTLITYLRDQMEADATMANKLTIDLGSISGITTSECAIYKESSKIDGTKFSIVDLLSGNINIVFKDTSRAEEYSKKITSAMMDAFKSVFASDVASGSAFVYANLELDSLLDNPKSVTIGDESKLIANSNSYNGLVIGAGGILGGGGFKAGINMSNILKSFLTYYAQSLGEFDTPYVVRDKVENSVYVTQDPNYYYILTNQSAVTEKDLLVANFYSSMYNNLCKSGWTTSAGDIDDKDYLSHALKNGQLFVSSMHGDYNYYQDAYTLNGHVIEVTDEEGIAQAELEYEKEKSTLNYKEEQLELDMKNLDTELSALTTEYDTVKNLISKNIEKVFTMFNS